MCRFKKSLGVEANMSNKLHEDIINHKDKARMEFLKIQSEKGLYLGEYKERVIAGLTKLQIIEDDVYPEIIESINMKEAYLLKMAREIDIKKLKPYILEAENRNLKYELVDGLEYSGDVGLVVVSKEALSEARESIIIRDMDQDFIDAGLGEIYSKNRGKRIDEECYEKVRKKLPQHLNDFKKLRWIDRLLGKKCPICGK